MGRYFHAPISLHGMVFNSTHRQNSYISVRIHNFSKCRKHVATILKNLKRCILLINFTLYNYFLIVETLLPQHFRTYNDVNFTVSRSILIHQVLFHQLKHFLIQPCISLLSHIKYIEHSIQLTSPHSTHYRHTKHMLPHNHDGLIIVIF